MRVLLISLVLLFSAPAAADQRSGTRLGALDARVELAPADLQVRLERAELRAAAGMPIEALFDLAVVAEADPDEPRMLVIRAGINGLLGSFDLALVDLDHRISQGQPSAGAHSLRARFREAEGDLAGALKDALEALRLAPRPERAMTAARLKTATEGPQAAAEICAEAADSLGGAVALRLAAIGYFREAGRPDLALIQVSSLLRASPEHADWLVLQGDVLDAAGRPAAARSARLVALDRLDEVLAIRPTRGRQAARAHLVAQLTELP